MARPLAHCWEGANGRPPAVRLALDSVLELAGLEPLDGFPEFKDPLPGGRRSSQTDLMVIACGADGLVAIAVEGKADEPFRPCGGEWLGDDPSPGKTTRLECLCDLLEFEPATVTDTRSQLPHRAASAPSEASRIAATAAVMLVHTRASGPAAFTDFSTFAGLLGSDPIWLEARRQTSSRPQNHTYP